MNWPAVAAYAATAWSTGYALLALRWVLAGGYPFGTDADPEAGLSVLAAVPAAVGAPAIAAVSLASVAAAVAMSRGIGHRVARTVLLTFGALVSVTLAAVIPDYRVLVVVAYAPILLLGAPFGWPSGVSLAGELTWPLVNQLLSIVGGAAWAGATIVYRRRTAGACVHCGRTDQPASWASPSAARRWGRWAIAVAVVVPLVYATSRWAWALGIPLGVSQEFLASGSANGMWLAGAMLATLAAVGAGLTVGLGRRWGEVVPGWLPLAGGRRVAPLVAIVPAGAVSIVVTSAGLMFVRLVASGSSPFGPDDWGAVAPELLWPVWGVALAASTLAYFLRRRGRCQWCGRGDERRVPQGRRARTRR